MREELWKKLENMAKQNPNYVSLNHSNFENLRYLDETVDNEMFENYVDENQEVCSFSSCVKIGPILTFKYLKDF